MSHLKWIGSIVLMCVGAIVLVLSVPNIIMSPIIPHDHKSEIESLNSEIETLVYEIELANAKLKLTDELLRTAIDVVVKQRVCECEGE